LTVRPKNFFNLFNKLKIEHDFCIKRYQPGGDKIIYKISSSEKTAYKVVFYKTPFAGR